MSHKTLIVYPAMREIYLEENLEIILGARTMVINDQIENTIKVYPIPV